MTWIKVADLPFDNEHLTRVRSLYPEMYDRPIHPDIAPKDGIVMAHSLIPQALEHALSTFGALISPDLPLTRKQQEMLATVVSSLNRCVYCSQTHATFLNWEGLEEELVAQLRRDYTKAALSPADRAMLDYAVQVTRDASKISPESHAKLRAVGFDDRGILQITLITAFFNYINRVADSLGVGRDVLKPFPPA